MPAVEAGVILAVGHNRRFWPSLRALRDIVASGQLGTILHVEGHNSNENSQKITAGWRLSPEESPGGGLTGAGLHVLDAFVSMLGPVRRMSSAAPFARARARPARYGDADDGFCQRRHRNAGDRQSDTVLLARACVRNAKVLPRCWTKPRWSNAGPAAKPKQHTYPAIDTLRAELDAFADAIERKRPFPVPEADVLATLSAFEAALASMKSQSPVLCHGP